MLRKRNPLVLARHVANILGLSEKMKQKVAREIFLPEPDYGDPFIATDFSRAHDRKRCDEIFRKVAGLNINGDALAQLHSPVSVRMENGGKRWRAVVVRVEVRKGRYHTIRKKTKFFKTQTETAIAACELIDGKRDYTQ